jgi:MFS family permease
LDWDYRVVQSLGMLIGTLAWGCFNDKYGAVIALPLSVLAQCVCQFLSLGFVDSEPDLLAACRFLSAGPCGWQGGGGSAGCVAEVIE